ncbi:hypothetical protein IscW_ISCW022665 [Ixodes scapularis]|uniref:PH domain-containing protein n=1 Tax=Ixodes scapularis TaxID=6945 RepID=B7QF83_IXOSC|nr:hypothetical protein IscW_ISCW022665 [Ixodes scapularis]|eukprot:XP_002414197.1 hypothetical protein IscW_ISCW022665 [Ixodes scapularis]
MRFNAKEICAVASQPSYKFEKEGILFIKERQDGLFRRSDVYTERWCRLRGNLLFYYKSKDQCSDPFGVIVLEQYTVKDGPITGALYCFSLAFVGEDLQLAAACAGEREAWLGALRGASYECVRLQLLLLRSRLRSRQRESDPGLYRGPQREAGDSGGTSFLFLARCAWGPHAKGFVSYIVPAHYQSLSEKLGDAESGEGTCSNPCFLTTVGFLKKQACATTEVKLCVYDVRERLTATLAQSASWDRRVCMGQGLDRISRPIYGWRSAVNANVRSPAFASDCALKLEANLLPHVGDCFHTAQQHERHVCANRIVWQTRTHKQGDVTLFKQVMDRGSPLERPRNMGPVVQFTKVVPLRLIPKAWSCRNLWINEEKQLMETVTQLGEVSLGPDWQGRQMVSLERHLHRMGSYSEALESLARHRGSHFKPSAAKGQRALQFAPVNMHLQRLWVHNTSSRKKCVYDVITVGAFTAFAQKYNQGGLHRMLNQLRNAYPSLQWVNPGFLDHLPEANVGRRLKGGSVGVGPGLSRPGRGAGGTPMLVSCSDLRRGRLASREIFRARRREDNNFLVFNKGLLKGALLSEELPLSLSPEVGDGKNSSTLTIEFKRSVCGCHDCPQCIAHRVMLTGKVVTWNTKFFPMGERDSASASDDSSSEDSSKDGAAETADRRDAGSVNGSVRSMDLRPTQLHKSDSMYSTDESRFSGLSEEFEPLVSETSLMFATLPASLLSSVRCLLFEPPHAASSSYAVRHRRDVCFSHALTSLVAALMAKVWCQQRDPAFLHALGSAGVLAQFSGLLSCHGDELAMLEDWVVALEDLGGVTFCLEPATNVCSPKPRVEGNSRVNSNSRLHSRPVGGYRRRTQRAEDRPPRSSLPSSLRFFPHFSLHAMNLWAHATILLTEAPRPRFGDQSFQERINHDGVAALRDYYRRLQKFPLPKSEAPGARGIQPRDVPLPELIEQIQCRVKSRKSKDVEILHLAMEACRRLRGLRFTSCKSAKDRTAMSVTLEQGQILVQDFGLDPKELPRAVACMRSEGTRRQNTFKNVGVRKYAFNSLQLMALPKQYRPPPGTFGNVQS